MVLLSAAWTCGMTRPASADATATWPVVFTTSRRDQPRFVLLLTLCLLACSPGFGVISSGQCNPSVRESDTESRENRPWCVVRCPLLTPHPPRAQDARSSTIDD